MQSGALVSFIYVEDRDRSLQFYRDALGLELLRTDGFGDFLRTGAGLIRMTVMPGHVPTGHPVLGFAVADLGAAMRELRERGVQFDVFDGMGQDGDAVWTAPDGQMRLAFFRDVDGNVITLSQFAG